MDGWMDEKCNIGLFPSLIGVMELLQLVPGRGEWAELVFQVFWALITSFRKEPQGSKDVSEMWNIKPATLRFQQPAANMRDETENEQLSLSVSK